MFDGLQFIEEFINIWNSGGVLMWPLLVIAVYIYWTAFDMFDWLSGNNISDKKLFNIGEGIVGEIELPKNIALMLDDIIGDNPDPALMRNRFSAIKAEYLPYIDRRLKFLSILTGIAPLLGLLGTVMGMLTTFSEMSQSSVKIVDLVAGGISEALVTTQTGLVIAVPALFMIMLIHNKRNRLLQFFNKLENVCYRQIIQGSKQGFVR